MSESGGSGFLLLGLECFAAANGTEGNAGESGESVSGRLRHGVDGDVEAVESRTVVNKVIVCPKASTICSDRGRTC